MAILNGHERTVTCVSLSATLGVVASGTKSQLKLIKVIDSNGVSLLNDECFV